MSNHPSSDYDQFAWFYNKHWAGPWVDRVMPLLEKLLLPNLPSAASILDLCCGTGQLAARLAERGFRVVGVDISEEMLSFARVNAPAILFHRADARSFSLDDTFDAAVSTYDSLNHLLTIEDIRKTFENVSRLLNPGAPFLFDLNMDVGYRERWKGSFSMVENDNVVAARSSYDSDRRTARLDLTLFRLEGAGWRRVNLALTQTCYRSEQIIAALHGTGFADPAMYNITGDRIAEETGRTFFLARKQ
ncbi:MAG: class I SAM-dependent methyltransferase [Candidatus Zixiibacteriota bacterium]